MLSRCVTLVSSDFFLIFYIWFIHCFLFSSCLRLPACDREFSSSSLKQHESFSNIHVQEWEEDAAFTGFTGGPLVGAFLTFVKKAVGHLLVCCKLGKRKKNKNPDDEAGPHNKLNQQLFKVIASWGEFLVLFKTCCLFFPHGLDLRRGSRKKFGRMWVCFSDQLATFMYYLVLWWTGEVLTPILHSVREFWIYQRLFKCAALQQIPICGAEICLFLQGKTTCNSVFIHLFTHAYILILFFFQCNWLDQFLGYSFTVHLEVVCDPPL